jgi:hypothetical protein
MPDTMHRNDVADDERRVYVFFREGMFYPIELRDDADARANAELNPGTLKVEDISGRTVWKPN